MEVPDANNDSGIVVIPSYNGKDLLENSIRSVNESEGIWSVVVVDNNSTDGTNRRVVEEMGAIYIQNKKNYGFGVACNIGIKYGLSIGAVNIAILNQDAMLKYDTLTLLSGSINNNKRIGITCPVVIKEDNSLYHNFAYWIVSQNKKILEDALFKKVFYEYDVNFLNAACWMFSAVALRKVGGFDPIFFMYAEDKELASRFNLYGYRMILNTQAIVIHETKLRADKNTLLQRIIWSSVRPTSNFQGQMRDYSRPYWRNLPSALRGWINGFVANLLAMDLENTLGYLIGLVHAIGDLDRNRRHYNFCRNRIEGLFLNLEEEGRF